MTSVTVLTDTAYRNANAYKWSQLSSGTYKVTALGSQLSNWPEKASLVQTVPYSVLVEISESEGMFFQKMSYISVDDQYNNESYTRCGPTFTSSFGEGWVKIANDETQPSAIPIPELVTDDKTLVAGDSGKYFNVRNTFYATIKLPDPATVDDNWCVIVFAQTQNGSDLVVKDHDDTKLIEMAADQSFMFFKSGDAIDRMQYGGDVHTILDDNPYGDLNNGAWSVLNGGKYVMIATGADISNAPDIGLLPGSTYFLNITLINEIDEGRKIFEQKINFVQPAGDAGHLRQISRGGEDMNNAIQHGWQVNAFTSDLSGFDPAGFADNEVVKYSADKGKFVGTGDFSTDESLNIGDKTLVAGVGTLQLGSAKSISSGGENVYFKNLVDGDVFAPVWHKHGDKYPHIRVLGDGHVDFEFQGDKSQVITNPEFTVTTTTNDIVEAFTVEADEAITGVIIEVYAGDELFWRENVGDIPANEEHKIDFLDPDTNSVPIDFFGGTDYQVKVMSKDGDVHLKGNDQDVPFLLFDYHEFTDQELRPAGGEGDGDVVGPEGSENMSIAIFDGATGKIIKDSQLLINGSSIQLLGQDPTNELAFMGDGTFRFNGGDDSILQLRGGDNPTIQLRDSTGTVLGLFIAGANNGTRMTRPNGRAFGIKDDHSFSGVPLVINSSSISNLDHALELNDGALKPADLTTEERDDLDVDDGALINNVTTNQLEEYRDGSWHSLKGTPGSGDGDVVGPEGAEPNELASFDGPTGKIIVGESDVSVVDGIFTRISEDKDLIVELKDNGKFLVKNTADGGKAEVTIQGEDDEPALILVDKDGAHLASVGYENGQFVISATTGDTEMYMDEVGTEFKNRVAINKIPSAEDYSLELAGGAFGLPNFTTTDRNDLNLESGALLNNTSLGRTQRYSGSGWFSFVEVGSAAASDGVAVFDSNQRLKTTEFKMTTDRLTMPNGVMYIEAPASAVYINDDFRVWKDQLMRAYKRFECGMPNAEINVSDDMSLCLGERGQAMQLNLCTLPEMDAIEDSKGMLVARYENGVLYYNDGTGFKAVHSAGGGPGEGDVTGADDSHTNEIITFADQTGKVLRSRAAITAIDGVIRSALAGEDLTILPNGDGVINIGSLIENEGIEVKSTEVKVEGYVFSGDDIIKDFDDFVFDLRNEYGQYVFHHPGELNVNLRADTDVGTTGVTFSLEESTQGGVGYRESQLVLQPGQWWGGESERGIRIDLGTNQTIVENLKIWRSGGDSVIEAEANDLEIRPKSGNRVYFGDRALVYISSNGKLITTSDAIKTDIPLQIGNGVFVISPITTSALNETLLGNAGDLGKVGFDYNKQSLVVCNDEAKGYEPLEVQQSLHFVVGQYNGLSVDPGTDYQKQPVQGLPVHHYTKNGSNAPHSDWNASTGTFTLPDDAPEGLYMLTLSGQGGMQGENRDAVNEFSSWVFWMARNDPDAEHTWGFTQDGMLPWSQITVYDDTFTSTAVKRLYPGDTLHFRNQVFYDAHESHPHYWYTTDMKFEVVFLRAG